MASIQISIEAKEAKQEILISELSDLGAEGFEQTDTHLIAYFNATTFRSDHVNALLKTYRHKITTLDEKNWNEVWESNFQPVIVNKFCAIRAAFHQPINNVEHEIIITPKMSFGTGHHATTYMMIEQMKNIDFTNKSVFDFGTGTGILSILAEKLGAAKISAIDVDEWSIKNTQENIETNHCEKIDVQLTSQLPDDEFDIILANINKNVILQYLSQLKTCLKTTSQLLLSGLLISDEEDILNACKTEALKLRKKSERSNWISSLFVKDL